MTHPSVSLGIGQAFRTCVYLAICSNRRMDGNEQMRSALQALCDMTQGGVEAVADASGLSAESLLQVLQRRKLPSGRLRGLGPKSRSELERAYPGWLSLAAGLPAPPIEGVAHPVSLQTFTIVPSINWRDLMDELPKVFKVELPDNSMAPRAQAGTSIEFSRGIAPMPGDGVLVKDNSGKFYFREYHQRRAGVWEAHASNPAYAPLSSAEDGLQIVAVLTGIPTRWAR